MPRLNKVTVIIGRRGSGKTYFTRKLMSASPLKKLVVDTFAHPAYEDLPGITPEHVGRWRSGNYRMYGSNFAEMFAALGNVRNSLVILEDATKYIPANVPDNIKNFLVDSKQKNVDVIIIYHGFGMVPPDIFRLADVLVLFKTNETIKPYGRKIPNFPEVETAFARVQASKINWASEAVLIN